MKKTIAFAIFTGLVVAECGPQAPKSPVNLEHAFRLMDSVQVNNQRLYYISIYADYPDYHPVEARGEGIACVDDVGRFLEVVETEILQSGKTNLLPIAKGLTNFLLYMVREDGRWYNFMDEHGQINMTHANSQADFGWWAVRGLRGLAAAHMILRQFPGENELLGKVDQYLKISLELIQPALANYSRKTESEFGPMPTWLINSAPDMNSELLMVLCKLQRSEDFDYREAIQKIAEGLVGYQFLRDGHPLNGMYFCWKTTWHDWGANQPTALLEAFQISCDSTFFRSAQTWADNFVQFLIAQGLPREITLNSDGSYQCVAMPQIAYGINALYSGVQVLADISGLRRYQEDADRIFDWFAGKNPARERMYFPETGITYDGINEDNKINRNSGAESTIEGLLAQQRHFYRE